MPLKIVPRATLGTRAVVADAWSRVLYDRVERKKDRKHSQRPTLLAHSRRYDRRYQHHHPHPRHYHTAFKSLVLAVLSGLSIALQKPL